MSSRHSRGPLTRALALVTASAALVLTGPVLPASAQQGPAEPPAPNPSVSAGGGPLAPLSGYQQKQACMQPGNGGNTIQDKPWSQLSLGFEQAHEQGYTGQNRSIGVIDTGVNAHPRLSVDGSGGSSVPGGALTDCDGHGTAVAGIASARQDPQTGFVGVAPNSRVLSLRQSSSHFQDQQSGKTVGDTDTMAQAINNAVAHGVDVINISQASCQSIAQAAMAGNRGNTELQTAVHNASQAGVVVVAAAGNVGDSCQKNAPGSPTTAVLPAWFDDDVLTVASVNQQGAPSEFTVPGPWVDVAAPGENLTSLDPGQGGTGLANQLTVGGNGQAQPIQGTSFAAPYVSGLVMLIKDKFEKQGVHLSANQIMERIKQTSMHPGGKNGRNDIVGYGMIDPMAALNDVLPTEHGSAPAPPHAARLGADVIPHKNWPAILVALGGAFGGVAAVAFTAFLINAVRKVRARARAAQRSQS